MNNKFVRSVAALGLKPLKTALIPPAIIYLQGLSKKLTSVFTMLTFTG